MTNPFGNKDSISISPSIVVFTVSFLLGLYFLFQIRSILTLLFLSFIMMVALNPGVNFLQHRLRFPRALSTVVIYVIVLTFLTTLLGFMIPPLTQELFPLLQSINFPALQEFRQLNFSLAEIGTLADRIGSSFGLVYSIVTSTFSGIFTFFTLIVISIYLMLERPTLHRKIGWFTRKPEHFVQAKDFIDSLELQLGSWVRGQLLLMITIGVLTYIGLTLLSVPYALPLALLAGLLEIVPNLGPTAASVPAIILAYLNLGPVMAGVVAIFYIVVQQLENNLIVPKIMKDNVDVNPLIAITTILIGLSLAGVVGALLAVPVYIVIRTIYGTWFRPRV